MYTLQHKDILRQTNVKFIIEFETLVWSLAQCHYINICDKRAHHGKQLS